ncbi:MAG TPA: SUMF1/EgtB/PvdO family nonheme iron enzyme [Anaerolineae bacterium]|nr:SUMF1/EgtB/PvdO family nonheme iron enzyme [Anaerolineae bacterium]HQH37474.1 SUMF1/EgtB/PvdO family nonheme iron enzyme [Anaerolineae bacterium]
MDYLDFELEIGPGEGQLYPVTVLRSPAGEAREMATFPFGELELENRLQALQIALLRAGGVRRQILAPEDQAVQDFGRALFGMLFSGEGRSRYDVSQREAASQGKGLRLKLRVQPPELAILPWEFAYDPRNAEYVCLSRTTPLVRYLELPQPVTPLRADLPLRILGMAVSPHGLPPLDVTLEKQRMETALADLCAAGWVALTWLEGQTWRDLQRVMHDGPWHVFHFIGHGGFDRTTEEGFVALADETGEAHRLSATHLGRLLADHRDLRLAVLNACEGAHGSAHDIFSSTASILVRRGLPAVLAMQYPITDRAAIEFARAFYEALADGLPVDTATTEARQAISIAAPHSVEWGIPVLYMRAADGALFDMRAGGREKCPPQPELLSAPPPEDTPDSRLSILHRLLVERFSLEELRTLCFHLGVDDERLPGEEKAGKARSLLLYLERRHQIDRLLDVGREWRPDVPWDTITPLAAPVIVPERDLPTSAAGERAVIEPAEVRPARQPFEPEIILIPAGAFVMGSDPRKSEFSPADEQPQHTLTLPAYELAKTPVTNQQYEAFVQATKYRPPAYWPDGVLPATDADHPVVGVSWYDALAYCRWLTAVTGKPYTLPSEAEWEKGARGADGRIYPWGNLWDGKRCNTKENRRDATTPVTAYPLGASPYGVLDMAGNVWEWTRSLWGSGGPEPLFKYPYNPTDGREALDADVRMHRILRGGSFNYGREAARCAYRNRLAPDSSNWYVGFRVVSLIGRDYDTVAT